MNYFINDSRDERYTYFFWVGLFVVMLLRTFYFGVTYFHFLDDYNTYGIFYRRNADIFNDIILWYGHFTFRPVAFFADAYITQWFWPVMWLVLLFYTIMHFATVYLFYKVLKMSKINFGVFGVILISLTPILFEAVYWIGASTRLVPGMFFSILSCFFLMRHLRNCDNNIYSMKNLVIYFVLNLISTGFYEQIVAFNFAFTLAIIVLNYYRFYWGFKFAVFVPFFSTIFMGLYYFVLASYGGGRVAQRGQLVELSDAGGHIIRVSGSIFNLLTNIQAQIYVNGFFRGITLIEGGFNIFIVTLVVLFSVAIFFSLHQTFLALEDNRDHQYLLRVIIGFILAIAPFMPFYILQNSFMAPRTVYPAIFGIAIILDTLLSRVSNNTRSLRMLKPAVSAIVIVPFFIIYIAEVNNFRLLEEVDQKLMANFLEAFEESDLDDQVTIVLFNTRYTYADTTTQSHRLENITSSDWALIGKANATSELFYFREMQPVQDGRTLPLSWAREGNGLFGIDEELNVFWLDLRRTTLYIRGTNQVFGTLMAYEDGQLMFLRE